MAEEEYKSCVQCGGTYDVNDNPEGACGMHLTTERAGRGYEMKCCGKSEPCVRKPHRPEHHCDYPYASFFQMAWAITGYSDTTEEFGTLALKDPESNDEETVAVSQLLRYVSRGDYIKSSNLLLVKVGRVWRTEKYWFKVYTEADLDAAGKGATPALIACTSEASSQYSKATWLIENEMVVGVRMEVKVKSFEKPAIREVRFTQFPLALVGVADIQKSGICELPVKTPYVLPPIKYNVDSPPNLAAVVKRPARTDFITWDAISGDRTLNISAPVVTAQGAGYECDTFEMKFKLSNAGAETHSIESLRIEYKPLNDLEWLVVPDDYIKWGYSRNPFPCFIGPKDIVELGLSINCPFPGGKLKDRPQGRQSHMARFTPLRFRVVFVDAKNKMTFRVCEHVRPLPKLEQPKAESALALFIDSASDLDRNMIQFEAPSDPSEPLVKGPMTFTVEEARAAVFKAQKSGVYEVDLERRNEGSYCITEYFAMVDAKASAVYALKVHYTHIASGVAVQGFVPIRFYGDLDAKPVLETGMPAAEVAALPTPQKAPPAFEKLFVDVDNGVDDFKEADIPLATKAAVSEGGGGGGGSVVVNVNLAEVEKQLAGLSTQSTSNSKTLQQLADAMTRTAVAMEKMAALQQLKYDQKQKAADNAAKWFKESGGAKK